MGLLTLANYNGDENENDNENENGDDNENENENDLPWAMCFCALPFLCLSFQPATFGSARAAYGIVSYLLLLLSLYLLLTPLILIFSLFLSSGFPPSVVSVFAFAAVASVFSSMPAILLSEF